MFAGIGAGIATGIGGIASSLLNIREAKKNRDWQAEMSNTAHQREVEDLKKAGLNPLLSATGGASTPSGAQATVENPVGAAVASALDVKRLKKDIDLADSQISTQKAIQERERSTAKNTEEQTKALKLQMPAIGQKSKYESKQYEWDSKAVEFDNWNRRIQSGLGTANSAKDLFNVFKLFMKGNDKQTNPILKEMDEFYKRRQP